MGSRGLILLWLAAILEAGAAFGTEGQGAGPAPAAPAYRSAPAEAALDGIGTEEEVARTRSLHRRLMADLPDAPLDLPFAVRLSEAELSDFRSRRESAGSPALVGRTKQVSETLRFSGLGLGLLGGGSRRVGRGLLQATPDGGFVWAAALRFEGAGGIRVHVTGLDLPEGADLYFFSLDGQAFGPYSGSGPNGDGDLWSNTIFGPEGVLLLRVAGPAGLAALERISFEIAELGGIAPDFAASIESFCASTAACVQNASCYTGTPADAAKGAVALMQWVSGAFIYTCTGGLLNDTLPSSQIPYFLTANHCLDRARDAASLETYFQFTLPCGSATCPPQGSPGGIQRLGATLLVTGTGGDFTLLQLSQVPPAGSVFLGWSNAPIANTQNAPLYRISHPNWAPQAYSRHHVDTTAPTCQGWPRGERIYSRDDVGATQGGSSGAPVVNGSGQVVGQLTGACGTNTGNPCDAAANATVDGAFAFYWPSVQPWLDPGPVPAEVSNLRWGSGAKDQLDWDAVASATSYDVYRGVPAGLAALRDGTVDSCTRLTTAATTTGRVLSEIPAAGAPAFYWFLVTGIGANGAGSAGSLTGGGERILDSSGGCP